MWMAAHGVPVLRKRVMKTCKNRMAIISTVNGKIIDTGVAQESQAHQNKESPAHQRSAAPPMPAAIELRCSVGWRSLWRSTWMCGGNYGVSPALGDTSITLAYFTSPINGSHGETIAVGVGVGMSISDAHTPSSFAPGTTVASVSGLVVGLSAPILHGGASIGTALSFTYSGLANAMYPSSWDAHIEMLPSCFLNYDNTPTTAMVFVAATGGGTYSGTADGDGYDLYNAPSKFSVNFTGGTTYGWGHDSTPSLYRRVYPATTDGNVGIATDAGPINTYPFQFGASVTLTSTQTFSPANYSGTIGVTGTGVGTNSDFSGEIDAGGITILFDLASGFSCSTTGVITSNSGSTSAGWSASFNWFFLYPWTMSIKLANMGFDATFGKATAVGFLSFDWTPM